MQSVATRTVRSLGRSETRKRLIAIGTEILSERGFNSTSIEDVLNHADVPKGSFYYYFASKADYGYAVIDNYAYLWEQKLIRLLRDPEVEPLQRVRNYIAESMRGMEKYAFKRGCLIGNMGQELAGAEDQFRSRILEVFDSWARYLAVCLKEAKNSGALSADFDVDAMAKYFWFCWEGAILQAKLERSLKPIELFQKVMFDRVLRRT